MAKKAPHPLSLEAAQHIHRLGFSVNLFQRNYAEINVAIRHLTDPIVSHEMSDLEDRWHRHEAMTEVLYLLHNYVASAKSLVDHTRRVYKKLYKADGLLPGYQLEVDSRFAADPLTQFVEDLREMAQHYRLPSISFLSQFVTTPGGVEKTCRLELKRDDLREYGGWTRPAVQFLNEAGDTIDVLQVLNSYHDHVIGFHAWFRRQQVRLHGSNPALLAHSTKYGSRSPEQKIMAEVTRRVEVLKSRPRDALTLGELHHALVPALTIWDDQRLRLCQHDPRFWLSTALEAIEGRFIVPKDVKSCLFEFVGA